MLKRQFNLLLKSINAHRQGCLDLSGRDFSDNQMFKLASAIKKNPVIKQVNFSGKTISDKGAKALADLKLKGLIVQKANASSKTKIEVPSLSDNPINIEESSLQEKALEIKVLVDKKVLEEPSSDSKNFTELEEVNKAFPEDFEIVLERLNNGFYNGEYLNLSSQELCDEQVGALVSAIEEHGSDIKRLNLSENSIRNEGAMALSRLKLEQLDLSSNLIEVDGTRALSKAKIKSLDLSGNEFGVAGAECFSETTYIEELSLAGCEIGDIGAQAVFKNEKLTILNLSDNNITDEGVNNISIASSLVQLSLNRNELTDAGAAHIATNENINILNLISNEIGNEGLKKLVEKNKLTKLNLASNNVTRIGSLDVFNSTKLEEVSLLKNQIHFEKEDSLPQKKRALAKINLGYNQLDSRCTRMLEALASIDTLQELDLACNNIVSNQVVILFQHKSPTLQKISLLGNPIEPNTGAFSARGVSPSPRAVT